MLLDVKNLRGGYDTDVIKNVSFSLNTGEALCIMGKNGCGKTTLFKLLLGHLKLSGGDIRYGGKDLQTLSSFMLAQNVSYVPQLHLPLFPYTVFEIVLMGRSCHIKPFGSPQKKDYQATKDALASLNILDLAERNYMKLSEGQRKLSLIARSLCQSSPIIIMDEPMAGLDFYNKQLISNAISSLLSEGRSVIFSSHEPNPHTHLNFSTMLIKDGYALTVCGSGEALLPEYLEAAYGLPMEVFTVNDKQGKMRHFYLSDIVNY